MRKRLLLSVMISALLVGLADEGLGSQGAVAVGDGVGLVRSANLAASTVTIQGREIRLTPAAVNHLRGQLAGYGWIAGEPFGAKYNVVRGGDGGPVIDSIHAYPPRRRGGGAR